MESPKRRKIFAEPTSFHRVTQINQGSDRIGDLQQKLSRVESDIGDMIKKVRDEMDSNYRGLQDALNSTWRSLNEGK